MKNSDDKCSLLIATDDDNSILIIKSVLEEHNYSIKIARSCDELYEEYTNKKIDMVILTSLGLAAKYILGCVVKLKMFDPKIKIIIMSNYEDENFIESLAAVGLDTIHTFPIDFDILHSSIQMLLKPFN